MIPLLTPPFFVFDVESIGLHGQTFSVAGGIYDAEASPLHEFAYHCDPIPGYGAEHDIQWVKVNVRHHASSIYCASRETIRQFFWKEWMHAKENHKAAMFVECGWPVEARFLSECIMDALEIRKWQGAYPMHEIASIMAAAEMDPMATYERQPNELPAHEPLADAKLSVRLLIQAINLLNATKTQ